MTEIQDDIADELVRLKAELATAKAETRRVREQLSLDVAEARVETGRALRQLNDLNRKLRETDAERREAVALILRYQDARNRVSRLLTDIAQSMGETETSEA